MITTGTFQLVNLNYSMVINCLIDCLIEYLINCKDKRER